MIAQVFYVLYKALTEDLLKGNKEAEKSTKQVSKELQEQDKHTENLKKGFKSLAVEIAGALGVAYTAGEFFRSLKDAADFGKQLSLTSNMMNINSGELQAWGNIIRKVGGTAEEFQSDLKGVADFFGTTPDNAFRLLPMLADNLSRLNRAQALVYGHSIGLSDETIMLLRKGNVELSTMLTAQKELGLITEADVSKFTDFNNTVVDTKSAFTGLTLALVSDAVPGLNKTFETITQGLVYLREHKSDVESFFEVFGVFAVSAIAAINPPLALLAATITGLLYLFKQLQDYEEKTPSAGQAVNSVNRFKDYITGNINLNPPEIANAAKLGSSNIINNSSRVATVNNTVNIDSVNTNDASKFVKDIKTQFNQSPAWEANQQAMNYSANGQQS